MRNVQLATLLTPSPVCPPAHVLPSLASPPLSCSGVVCLVEVLDGRVQKGDKITAASTGGLAGSAASLPPPGRELCSSMAALLSGEAVKALGGAALLAECACGAGAMGGGAPGWRSAVFVSSSAADLLCKRLSYVQTAGTNYEVNEVGLLAPDPHPTGELLTGQVSKAGVLPKAGEATRAACSAAALCQPRLRCKPPGLPTIKSSCHPLPPVASLLQVGYMLVGMKDTRSGEQTESCAHTICTPCIVLYSCG